ncbi:ATP-dependent helicase HrpB [Aliikangiella sp. IMCC44653]
MTKDKQNMSIDKQVAAKIYSMDFPVVPFLPTIEQAFEQHANLILEAEPGAGKTSLVPLALVQQITPSKKLLLLEPRRIAAKNAATRLAELVEQPVGQLVGYAMREAAKVSAITRIEVVTEGVLLSRLQQDPELSDVGAIIFDEFHERSLNADLSLAFCLDVQQSIRADLKLVVMSATIDSDSLIKILPQAKKIQVPGRSYPVAIDYIAPKNKHLNSFKESWKFNLAEALALALKTAQKDILVFLPGVAEINLAEKIIQESGVLSSNMVIKKLHANLSFAQQVDATCYLAKQRKIILSTNIAESSLTIAGVDAVIDSGLVKISRFDPNSGFNQLVSVPISAASAAQRAGRAGRLRAGSCWRLWASHSKLKAHLAPEILRCDLASLVLKVKDWGAPSCKSLALLEQPSEGSINQAESLLQLLGLIGVNNQLTDWGRAVVGLNIEPRLGAMLVCGLHINNLQLACIVAATIEEKQSLRFLDHSSSDFALRVSWVLSEPKAKQAQIILKQAKRYFQRTLQLKRLDCLTAAGECHTWQALDQLELSFLPQLLAAAFPDRVAMRRNQSYKLANGKGASLPESQTQPDYIIAVHLSATQSANSTKASLATIYLYQAVDLETLRSLFEQRAVRQISVNLDSNKKRVVAQETLMLGQLPLAQSRPCQVPQAMIIGEVLKVIESQGVASLAWNQASLLLMQRVNLLRKLVDLEPEFPDLSFDWLQKNLSQWLLPCLTIDTHCTEFNLSTINGELLQTALQNLLGWDKVQQVKAMLPDSITLPSGYRAKIDYANPAGPVLAVKLQLLFGVTDTPKIANGRLALSLHLLSPAGRPLQVTQDLASFWQGSYSEVKKEMRGRYPKHPWPDDPIQASATHKTKTQL